MELNSKEFNEKVLNSKKPVLVDFFASWCGPCKMIAPLIEKMAEEKKDKIDVYKLDIDQASDLAAQYGVQSIPTLVIFKGGKDVDRHIGALQQNALNKWIDSHL